jgi:hypothetical protein
VGLMAIIVLMSFSMSRIFGIQTLDCLFIVLMDHLGTLESFYVAYTPLVLLQKRLTWACFLSLSLLCLTTYASLKISVKWLSQKAMFLVNGSRRFSINYFHGCTNPD